MIPNSITNNRLGFHELGNKQEKSFIVLELETPEVLRKQMELNLVKLVQEYQRKGLNIKCITVDVVKDLDARVTLCHDPAENLDVQT
ncbi:MULTISPECIES: hypothetical protein [Acinetobacter]|uniref:hypothetical protein n=1 Tax=Acinetobacter TaxID=469 RepID=UPI00070B29EE|nr:MULTISPECIES: hypothetical protein [Acinetobacter]KRJ70816.1 hypothetical protein APC93_11820 [Acinetobacter pittii]MDA3462724.1 hypothetical protein [Acinetobacter sp. AOR41_HL]